MRKYFLFFLIINVLIIGFTTHSTLALETEDVEIVVKTGNGTGEKILDRFLQGIKGAWQQCLKIWRRMWEFFRNIWDSYIFPFLKNIWEKIRSFFGKKIERTEELIEEKIEEKGLWQRFKEWIR